MKTKSFKQIIDRLIDKGVDNIKIMRSKIGCGIIKQNDIISIEVTKNDNVYVASLQYIFDMPIISVSRIIRNENGLCISLTPIGRFKYTK